MGAMKDNGYGDFSIKGKVISAHQFAYVAFVGPLIPGEEVCHTCDVRCCANPNHLFQGTRSANMIDAARKGRLGHRTAKLTNKQADEIRQSKKNARALSEKYAVSMTTICNVRRGVSYAVRHTLSKT